MARSKKTSRNRLAEQIDGLLHANLGAVLAIGRWPDIDHLVTTYERLAIGSGKAITTVVLALRELVDEGRLEIRPSGLHGWLKLYPRDVQAIQGQIDAYLFPGAMEGWSLSVEHADAAAAALLPEADMGQVIEVMKARRGRGFRRDDFALILTHSQQILATYLRLQLELAQRAGEARVTTQPRLLADFLGFSQAAMRQALAYLHQVGLLSIQPIDRTAWLAITPGEHFSLIPNIAHGYLHLLPEPLQTVNPRIFPAPAEAVA